MRYWGDDDASMGQYANVSDRTAKSQFSKWTPAETTDGHPVSAPVGSLTPNAFGLYDTIGNVYEWCEDWYDEEYYGKSPSRNPVNVQPALRRRRVLRGGSWAVNSRRCRAAHRLSFNPDSTTGHHGFRVVRTQQ